MLSTRFKIKDDVLQQTTKCLANFKCLECEECPGCEVEQVVANIIFVKAKGSVVCPYSISFGEGYFCACPTRSELYKRYKG